ncbi:MAG: metallophosphoesterase [Candidatus Sumerlaeota bacterium]|nr:metallophosphoesterase [Candidatus Sumerlaeota bacterium]
MSLADKGRHIGGDRQTAWHLALLVGACLGLWGWTGGWWDVWGPDESRCAMIGREIAQDGHWRVPTLYGEPYDQKPPAPFWMFAGIWKAAGGRLSSGALRLPSVLFAMLTVLLTYGMGRRLFNARAGLISAFALLTSAQVLSDAPSVELNMLFSGWIALALCAWLTRPPDRTVSWPRAIVLWGALAGAFFTKGPLAIVIVLSVIGTEAAFARSWRVAASARPGFGAIALLALIGGWQWMVAGETGWRFVLAQAKGETVERFLSGAHGAPPWYYAPRLFTSIFFPWVFVLIPAAVRIWRRRRDLPAGLRPLLGWAIIPFVVLSIAHGKRESYLLPLLPGMALIVGWFLDRALAEGVSFPRFSAGGGVALLLAGMLAAPSAVALWFRPDLAWTRGFYALRPGMICLFAAGLALIGIGVFLVFRRRSAAAALASAAATLYVAGLALYILVNPALNPRRSCRLFSQTVDEKLAKAGGVAEIGAIEKAAGPEYHLYGSYRVKPIDEQSVAANPNALPAILVARMKSVDEAREKSSPTGYQTVFVGEASGDAMAIYTKGAPKPEAPGPETVRIALIGDTGHSATEAAGVAEQVARVHAAAPFDALFLLGDNIANKSGWDLDLQEFFEKPFAPVLERKIPVFAILGNHDDDGHWAQELHYPAFHMDGRVCYAQTFGHDLITFFALDSDRFFRNADQMMWLRDALRSCRSRYRVVLAHQPMVSSRVAHEDDAPLRETLLPLLTGAQDVDRDVDMVFAGHNHMYERRKATDGILFVTAGNGSKRIKEPLPDDPGREFGDTQRIGFVAMAVTPERVELTAIDRHGDVFDRAAYRDQESPRDFVEIAPEAPTSLPVAAVATKSEN